MKKDDSVKDLIKTFPNFFCDMEVLNALIGKECDRDDYGEVDFTIDVIDAPFMILYKAEEKNSTVKIYKRRDVYTHDESGYCIGTAVLDKISGSVSMDFQNSLDPNRMGTFVVACLKLNEYIQENNLSGIYNGLDAEKAGVLITQDEGKLAYKVVAGKERPDIMCDTVLNGLQMCRPYADEENDDSPFGVFRNWVKKEEQYGQFVVNNELNNGNVTIRCVVTGTHHGGRADRIEYITVGDSLTLKREFDSQLTPDSIEVFNSSDESLGWIEVYMSDILAPLIDDEIVTIGNVIVASVIPKSQRGKRARAAEMFIDVEMHIDFDKINNDGSKEEGLNEEDTELEVPKESNEGEQPATRSDRFVDVENQFKLATKDELVQIAIASARKIVEVFSDGDQVGLMLLVFGAKLGLVGDGVINEEEKELVGHVFGPIVDGDLLPVYDMICNEIEESDYELVRVLTEMGNNVVMPFLHFILSFAYIDQVLENEVAKRLEVLFGLHLLVEDVQSKLEDIPLSETESIDSSSNESLPVSKEESVQSKEGYKVVEEEETITVNDDFRITLQKGMYYATSEHVKLDEMAILHIGRLKADKQDAEGYIQINVNKDADFFGTFFAKEFEHGQYEQVLEKFDFEKYLREKTLQESNESEEQINEWATEIRVKTDFYSTYKVYKNEDNLKIGYYSNLIDGLPAYMIQIITRKSLYMCNSVFTSGVFAIGLREFLGDSVADDKKFLDGILNSITLVNTEAATIEKAQPEGSEAAEEELQKQLEQLVRETTDALHEIDKMWDEGKCGLQQQWSDKTYTFGLEVQMDAVVVRKMIDNYAPLYEKLLDTYDESAELLWSMSKSNTFQLMCAEKSLEVVKMHYEGMDSLRYDFKQAEMLNESTISVSYTRSSDSVKEKWERRRDESRKQEDLAEKEQQFRNDVARWEEHAEKTKADKEREKQSQYEQIDADTQRQKEEVINAKEQERNLIEEKKNRNRESLRLHRLELESLGAMRLLTKRSLEKIIREEELQDTDFDIEIQANQIRLKDELKALDWQAEEKKRELLKELDEKYQIPKSPEVKKENYGG